MSNDTLNRRILLTVERLGDPLLDHILAEFSDTESDVVVRQAVRSLVGAGMLRMKDDDIDHDWCYVLTSRGRAAVREFAQPDDPQPEALDGE